MTKTLSRSELYELVWARPRSGLAKELGVSDVAIGKACTRAFIPAPPLGYWARKAVGKAGRRPPLPIRMPGQASDVTFGPDPYGYYGTRSDNVEEPLAPPVFPELMDEQIAAAMKVIGKVSACRDLSSPHKALRRVMQAEAKRREKTRERAWTFDKPYFDDPVHQRQLRVFNAIARALAPVATLQEVSVHDEWIRGVGTLRHLRLRTRLGQHWIELRFDKDHSPSSRPSASAAKDDDSLCLATGSASGPSGILEWKDAPGAALETQLPTIVQNLLRHAEVTLRHSAQWTYERKVKYREEAAQKREAAQRERDAQRLEEIAAQRAKLRQHIIDLGAQLRAAGDIRDMVTSLADHPELSPDRKPLFDEWASLALSIADELDPRKRPLDQLIAEVEKGERKPQRNDDQ